MKNIFTKWTTFVLLTFLTINANAVEVQVLDVVASGYAAATSSGTTTWVQSGTSGLYVAKATVVPAGVKSYAPAGVTGYFSIDGGSGGIKLPPVDFNNGGRIVVRWGCENNRTISLSGVTITATTGVTAVTTSAGRSMLNEATFTISDNGLTTIQVLGSGSSDFIFEIIVYTNSKGPIIDAFTLAGVPATVSIVDATTGTIAVKVPYAINLTSLVPTITLAAGTTFVNAGDATAAKNFTSAVTYPVTNGTDTRTYTVTVTKDLPSTACDILTFGISNQVGTTTFLPKSTSGGTLDSILVTMPYSSSLTSLAPTYTISPLASSSTPASGVAHDFTSPSVYTVVAQDGTTTHSYGVRVIKTGASKACSILGFSLGLTDESVQIKESDTTIQVIVGSSDVISNITSVVTTTTPSTTTPYIKISPIATVTSPSFPIDYTNSSTVPVKIKVMAEDNSVYKVYSVKVIRDINPPVLSATIPLDKATDASLAGNIMLTYTDTYSPTLKIVDATKITLTGGAGSLGTASASGLVASIFFKGLTAQTTYTLKIGAGAFSDAYGNLTSDTTITFTTASSVNSTLPYASHMNGANFALPAFITDPTTYDATFDTKATVTTEYGAYKLNPGDTLWVNTQSIGSIYANIYALGINRYYSIGSSVNATVTTDTITYYSATGASVKQKIDYTGTATTPAKIYITNSATSSGAIYIPYIYLSAVGVDPLTEKQVWCTSK
ncbi:MAG: hypothetical protein P4L28_05070 [Paludibacteraceae bacterium]|nr:hypothetical protein [Paludibacteraceae bacterium]